jgi:hypothetical protein
MFRLLVASVNQLEQTKDAQIQAINAPQPLGESYKSNTWDFVMTHGDSLSPSGEIRAP